MEFAKKLYLASSNSGKLREFSAIAAGTRSIIELALLPGFLELAPFPEDAPTFAENAVGKALYASAISAGALCADDSGLVVPALGGEPGVRSARYAGSDSTDTQFAELSSDEKNLHSHRGKAFRRLLEVLPGML